MILSGRWLVPISSPCIDHGAVAVEGDRIVGWGTFHDLVQKFPGHEVRRFPDAAILPGFVNAHSHLELTVFRGFLDGLQFWDWIRRLTRAKYEVLNQDDVLASALLGAAEAVLAGITTLGDPMDLGASLDGAMAAGLRAVLFQEVFSPKPEEADAALRMLQGKVSGLKEKLAHWDQESLGKELFQRVWTGPSERWETRKARITLGVSPHAPYTVSAPLFQKVHAYAQELNLPVCIHIAESLEESLWLHEGTGPIAESWLQRGIPWQAQQCSPIEYLRRLGVIDRSTLLVHCVRLEEPDYQTLETLKPAVAHCPKSNWKLRHGAMNLKKVRQCDLPIGLGSDSVASNNTLDFFEEMRAAFYNPCWMSETSGGETISLSRLGPQEALRMATLGGAEALDLASQAGSIETGKLADLIAVDLSPIHVTPVFSPVDALVFSARADDVLMTMVGGEILMENRQLRSLNVAPLLEHTERVRKKLLHALC